MSERQLFLLSPYSLPTDHPLMLSDADMAAWLHGYLALWHPSALVGASQPPKQASQYDHEQPTPGHLYAVPDSPPLYLPDDWQSRVTEAGACAFAASADRTATLIAFNQAMQAFGSNQEIERRLETDEEPIRAFQAIGFGYLIVEHLFDAMQHEHVLSSGDFWRDVQSAVAALTDPDRTAYHQYLQDAAEKLQAAREVLYPTTMQLLNIFLPDERNLDGSLPSSFDGVAPINLIASVSLLRRLKEEYAARFDELRSLVNSTSGTPAVEVCSGAEREREDAILPVESQLWNLRRAISGTKELLGVDVRVFARRRSAFHPQLPQFLLAAGYEKALFLTFDGAVTPTHRSTVVSWSSPDGKQLDVFCRPPKAAHESGTFFNLVHALHESITQDSSATLALLHTTSSPAPGYAEWLELSRFGPVLGQWTTFSRYFSDSVAGEYAPAATVDEFFADYLEERTNAKLPDAVSGLVKHLRIRRRIDTAWTLAAIHRALGGGANSPTADALELSLTEIEDEFESRGVLSERLTASETTAARLLADRLQVKAVPGTAGYMLLNPCSFVRRMSLELEGMPGAFAVEGPVKVSQFQDGKAFSVVEVPAFGFAWIPRPTAGTEGMRPRLKMADRNIVRNEFLEAEIDMQTGGLRAIRDLRTRINRLGQQLVFNPGSLMKAKEVRVTANGAALGEITSEGALLNEHNEVIATFRQRFRAWLGRPLLDIRIEIYPEKPPEGYPWHAYYGARFAWRDERATLFRGQNGASFITNHTRPVTPDFLEVRLGNERTTIFPGGLPFHQRHGARMVDVILIPEAEQARSFEISIGLDREYPSQTALGLATPTTMIPVEKGPPYVGPSGWLFHLDAPNLVVTSFRPVAPPAGCSTALVATMLESTSYSCSAEWRCARNPSRACQLDAADQPTMDYPVNGDAVSLEVGGNDLLRVRVEFP